MQATVGVMDRPRPTIHFHAATHGVFPFPHAYRKRKRSSNYSSEDENEVNYFHQSPTSPIVSSPDDSENDHRNKRPRRTHIEYGMGGMTLQSHISPVSSSGGSFAGSSVATGPQSQNGSIINHPHYVSEPELLEYDEAFMPRELESGIVTPQVEEVPSPTAPKINEIDDITMKGPSWFEPEKDRIVITDLDGYDSEEDSKYPTPPTEPIDGDSSFEISPAYLLHFGGVPRLVPLPKESQDNLALVAYRPPIILPQRPYEVEEPSSDDQRQSERPAHYDLHYYQGISESDAMDIDE